jgi:ActR/RegA family two-component response regulator
MIFLVDEDQTYGETFTMPLVMRGFDVKILGNADKALNELSEARNVELVIVDIMLATAPRSQSKFGVGETNGLLLTGLVLLRRLRQIREDIFPGKFVVLTAASEPGLVSTISSTCSDLDVPVLWKGDYKRPANLADRLVGIMRGDRGGAAR